MRLIDADALKAHIMEFACDPCKKFGADRDGIRCPFCNTGNLLGEIDDAQTVDVVEVVRCKDCKHWGSTISQADREQCASQGVDLVCNYWETDGLYADDFCSYGERKETENEL